MNRPDLRRKRILLIAFCIIGINALLSASSAAAQDLRRSPSYIDSILKDEEDVPLTYPTAVVSDPVRNEIYVVEGRGRIIIYTADLFPLFTISTKQGVERVQAVTVDRDGYVYVSHVPQKGDTTWRLSVLNPRLRWERDITFSGLPEGEKFSPYRLAVDRKGNLIVSGFYGSKALVIDPKTGAVLDTLMPLDDGKPVSINYVTVDGEGRIYLLSEEASRIFVYDEDRKFLFKFGEKGGSTGKLSRPQAVGIDLKAGLMFVPDFMRHSVLAYDRNSGNYLFEFGGLGWSPGWFQHPRDLVVDSEGRIIVADTFNMRVQVLQFREKEVE